MKPGKRGGSNRRRANQNSRKEQDTYDGDQHIGTEAKEYEWIDDEDDEEEFYRQASPMNEPRSNDVYSVSSSFQDIKEEDETLYEVVGYNTSIPMYILFVFLSLISIFFLPLFCFWLPFLYVKLTCRKCKLSKARYVLIRTDKDQKCPDVSRVFRYKAQGTKFNLRTAETSSTYVNIGNEESSASSAVPSASRTTSPLPSRPPPASSSSSSSSSGAKATTQLLNNNSKKEALHKYFLVINHKEFRYIYSKTHKTFVRVSFETRLPFSELRKLTNVGYTDEEREEKVNLYGRNAIHTPRSNIFYLCATELLQPFFIFQFLSFLLWCAELYYSYAVFVLCVVVFLLTWNVLDIKTELKKVKELVFESSDINIVRYE